MRALFLNDYAMDRAYQAWVAGEYPAHHLYGTTELPGHGIDVDILPFTRFARLKRLTKRRCGDLDQQVRAFTRRDVDVIYAGCQFDTMALAAARSLRLLRTPVVATMHHQVQGALARPSLFRTLYGGHDALLCMSRPIRREVVERIGFPSDRVAWVGWPVDIDFYDRHAPRTAVEPTGHVMAAGKTKRDYRTLAAAARGLPAELHIYCSAASAPTGPLPSNVRVHYSASAPTQADAVDFSTLIGRYLAASVVAIPLASGVNGGNTGLTSVLEAMALSKPIVMTRTRWLDIDLEREGIGLWVDDGDVRGWHEAIGHLLAHPEAAREMGQRGRRVAEERFSVGTHGNRIAAALRAVIAGQPVSGSNHVD